MTDLLDIFWPDIPPPDISEVRFSYEFCKSVSRHLCADLPQCLWRGYVVDETIQEILTRASGNMLLVVTDPEIVFCADAIEHMIRVLAGNHLACGPTFNETAFSRQMAHLPAPYFSVQTYIEIAGIHAGRKNATMIAVEELDPGCVLYRRSFLETIDPTGPLSGAGGSVPRGITGKVFVDTGALVHRFGNYYEGERNDLIRLVPETVKRVLDVGCAKGAYGRRLKQERPDVFLMGVEMNPLMADSARAYYDDIITQPVEKADLPKDFDLINCGDVLEHLQNPWRMLNRIYQLLKQGGFLILSVPNMGHWSLVRDLLQGRFEYIPVGLTCVTHIRWFTEQGIRTALENAGFDIDILHREQHPPTPRGQAFIRKMCHSGFGDETSLMTNEFIIRAVKTGKSLLVEVGDQKSGSGSMG